ncbi:MAG: hypothetical protein LVQ63_00595 [Thermoplasmatales archaeon]|nr:hypothetical protein [Thermoplasmatales archaeon]
MKNYVAKGIELISTIYVPMAMLVAALSSSILLFLASSVYLPASVQVIIVLGASSIFVSGNILSVSLQGIRKTKIFLISSSVALLSNFILSILLIPKPDDRCLNRIRIYIGCIFLCDVLLRKEV